ncbi:hypothetical protein UNPF46_08535 [Bradyrhizobium sp. UNPF46]|nr:hypothetical protein UNPF46_08535 [Bradyrhizobium sp. UNPF46]
MNPTFKRYLISSLTTFASTFLLTAGAALKDGFLSNEAFTASAIIALIMVAGRAGFKAVIEGYLGAADA